MKTLPVLPEAFFYFCLVLFLTELDGCHPEFFPEDAAHIAGIYETVVHGDIHYGSVGLKKILFYMI